MKGKLFLLILLLFASGSLIGQPRAVLTLQEAYQLFEARYPSLKDAQVIDAIIEKELERLEIQRLPSIFLKADGRLQSQSTQLQSTNENFPIEIDQPLVSAKTYVEANYLLVDGGINEAQEKLQQLQHQVSKQELEVRKFSLRERINQLFISINTTKTRSSLIDISLENIATRRESVEAGVSNGIILESELHKLAVNELELEGQKDNLTFAYQGALNTLADLLDIELEENTHLQLPKFSDPFTIPVIERPEQEWFKLQREAVLVRSDLIDAEQKLKVNLFAQAGVGYPNPLNILDNGIAPYGIIGAGLNWRITDWNQSKLEKELLSLETQKLQHAEETFLFNLESARSKYESEVKRLQKRITRDQEIANLQKQILDQMAIQLDEGVISATDYLLQLNTELLARENSFIHSVELTNFQLQFLTERGGL